MPKFGIRYIPVGMRGVWHAEQRQLQVAMRRPVRCRDVEDVAVARLHGDIEPHPVNPAGEARDDLAADGLDDTGGLQRAELPAHRLDAAAGGLGDRLMAREALA